ncbi:hypothetical protein DFQ26_007967, partial [Actinomortierella ambigua]
MTTPSTLLTLFCIVDGETTAFSVKAPSNDTVDDLKKLIKAEKAPRFDGIAADELTLWRVSIPVLPKKDRKEIRLADVPSKEKEELDETEDIAVAFAPPKKRSVKSLRKKSTPFMAPPKKTIHIIVQRPPPQAEDWQKSVAKIEGDLFTPGVITYEGLIKFVKAGENVPTTEGRLGGLPSMSRRSGPGQSSLLFLNLPESRETQSPPSTADRVLERIREQSFPLLGLFGVSGCGKTRTVLEMLSKTWGFYFNGSEEDWGSRDLINFLQSVKARGQIYGGGDEDANNRVHILAMSLVLCRIMVLGHCLDIAEREGTTFTCKQWMLLQIAPVGMNVGDVFATLFSPIADVIHSRQMDITTMEAFVKDRFSRLYSRLQDLDSKSPSKVSWSKVPLVIDEAQTLGTDTWRIYVSHLAPSANTVATSDEKYRRPILSPFVQGLYRVSGDQSRICVVPCGTGLSIYEMEWLAGSAVGPKGDADRLRPFIDFEGWTSLEQVQSYRALVRRSLSTEESKSFFDVCVPEESIPLVFERLRGRYRPCVFAVESMIESGNKSEDGNIDWREAVMETERRLISTSNRYFWAGNIVCDISRMITRVQQNQERYKKFQNVRSVLQFFVLSHFLKGRSVVLNQEEAPLVEASVGRIMEDGETTKTVLDEPFVLRAAVNYFQHYDSEFYSAL